MTLKKPGAIMRMREIDLTTNLKFPVQPSVNFQIGSLEATWSEEGWIFTTNTSKF